ncbi:hypothetical protein SpAn4DRAFT_3443 [Sporomusa ovata]|uniref:Uncharacterized protein n=1 Tax=Sporomusa ovata TaxID=2378 RepID=A0A0U1KVX0_9FIRM|nr:hypothetical protein SpAn4DRAFT_3443 [Sporomusa ovata]
MKCEDQKKYVFTSLREALSPAESSAGKGFAEMHLVAGELKDK